MCGFCTVWMCEAYVIMWVWIWWVLIWCGCFGNGKQHSLTALTEVFPCFSSVVRQMPGLNSQSRGTDRISSELLSFVLCLSLCCAIVFMLFCCYYVYCYCVALLLFVLSYVLIVCTVPLPPGVNPIAVDKYRVIHKSLRNFRTRLRNNQERHGRKEHINR